MASHVILGGVSTFRAPCDLTEDGKNAVAFAQKNNPDLKNLLAFTTQVVQGINYGLIFEGQQEVVHIWSQPSNNGFLQVTLPNGNKVVKHQKLGGFGQWTDYQDPKNLDEHGKEAEAFARAQIPNLGVLTSFRTQVVSGTNYGFKFAGHPDEVRVYRTFDGHLELLVEK